MQRVESLEKTDAGRDWGQEEKGTTEDEMAGWHHWLIGCESEWTPGVVDGQGGLACCDSWGRRVGHNWATELNWTDNYRFNMGIFGGSVVKKLPANVGDTGSDSGLGRSRGEENGNPLQYSCLGNPMDRGALQTTVHWVIKSRTRLSDWARMPTAWHVTHELKTFENKCGISILRFKLLPGEIWSHFDKFNSNVFILFSQLYWEHFEASNRGYTFVPLIKLSLFSVVNTTVLHGLQLVEPVDTRNLGTRGPTTNCNWIF